MYKVKAPAKLNLTLEVLRKRPDGYHEIRTVLQAIDLCDTLRFKAGDSITFRCGREGWAAENSLVTRAVTLLKEAAGCEKGVGTDIEKRIPLVSGLGGDSSDAAAVLRGLNNLWKLGFSRQKLLELAGRLGSDVAFFLYGGTAMAEGRGNIITLLPPVSGMWVVLVVPDVPREAGKTAAMYNSLKPEHYSDGKITAKLVDALHKKTRFSPSFLFNTFENVAFDYFKGLMDYKKHILKLGASHIHLAGSGPTLFTMFDNQPEAEDLFIRCQNQGMETYLAGTLE